MKPWSTTWTGWESHLAIFFKRMSPKIGIHKIVWFLSVSLKGYFKNHNSREQKTKNKGCKSSDFVHEGSNSYDIDLFSKRLSWADWGEVACFVSHGKFVKIWWWQSGGIEKQMFQQNLQQLVENRSDQEIWKILAYNNSDECSWCEQDFTRGISSCAKFKLWKDACKLLNRMSFARLLPNVYTYSAAVSAYEKGCQWQHALNLFEQMELEVQPNVFSYSSMISAFEKGDGQWHQALSFFKLMLREKVRPNVISYNASISACEKAGRWLEALSIFDAILEARVQAQVTTYNATISACEKGSQWNEALRVFRSMLVATLQQDVISFSAAITACEKGSQWLQACELFLVAMPSAQVQANVISCGAAISACQKGRQWEQSLSLFATMFMMQLRANLICISATISACEIEGKWKQALSLFRSLQLGKMQPNVIAYSATINACEKACQWQEALVLFDEIPKVQVQSDILLYSSTISACQKGGQWQTALRVFNQMPQAALKPNVICLNAAIEACEKGSQWHPALILFDSIPKSFFSAEKMTGWIGSMLIHAMFLRISCVYQEVCIHSVFLVWSIWSRPGELLDQIVSVALWMMWRRVIHKRIFHGKKSWNMLEHEVITKISKIMQEPNPSHGLL